MAFEVRRPGPALNTRTSLGLGGVCLAEAVLKHEDHFDELETLLSSEGGRVFVLGAGTNLLAEDTDLDIVLVNAANLRQPTIIGRGEGVLVRVGAGVRLPSLLGWAARNGLSGLENLAGIPGTVGGAVAMNAGSYGTEMRDVLSGVNLWSPKSSLGWREASQCGFDYRSFQPGLDTPWIVWEAEFTLTNALPESIRAAMRYAIVRKKATQPVTAKSAGCVFKNPVDGSAGQMLDEAGMRGYQIGGMAFSEKHANFLVNEREGNSTQALELLAKGKRAVRERFGVDLETEVIILS